MAFKLMMSAQGKWQKLNGANRMPELIQAIAFIEGIKQIQTDARSIHHQLSGIAHSTAVLDGKNLGVLIGIRNERLQTRGQAPSPWIAPSNPQDERGHFVLQPATMRLVSPCKQHV